MITFLVGVPWSVLVPQASISWSKSNPSINCPKATYPPFSLFIRD